METRLGAGPAASSGLWEVSPVGSHGGGRHAGCGRVCYRCRIVPGIGVLPGIVIVERRGALPRRGVSPVIVISGVSGSAVSIGAAAAIGLRQARCIEDGLAALTGCGGAYEIRQFVVDRIIAARIPGGISKSVCIRRGAAVPRLRRRVRRPPGADVPSD